MYIEWNIFQNICIDANSLTNWDRDKMAAKFVDVFKCIYLNENIWILIEILLKFVPKDPITNITTLVQIMAWRW